MLISLGVSGSAATSVSERGSNFPAALLKKENKEVLTCRVSGTRVTMRKREVVLGGYDVYI